MTTHDNEDRAQQDPVFNQDPQLGKASDAPETVPGDHNVGAVVADKQPENCGTNRPTPTVEDAKQWYDEARSQTPDTLVAFLKHINDGYEHSYDSAVWAVAAGALAGAWAMNKQDQMGITGFQAGGVMWTFVRDWLSIKGPIGLLRYEEMLWPQHADRFTSISKSMFEELQRLAAVRIAEVEAPEDGNERAGAHPDVLAHWKSIVAGTVPFGYTIRD